MSSVWAHSVPVGAQVKCQYFETTTGNFEEERVPIVSHQTIVPALLDPTYGFTNQLTVTPFHNKPYLLIEVTGAPCEFGVYITVVQTFASDLDAALKFDQEDVNLSQDKGIPITAYNETTQKWNFLKTGPSGSLSTETEIVQVTANKFLSGFAAVSPSDIVDVLTYTVPALKTFQLLSAHVSSTGDFKHELLLNDVTIKSAQTSFMHRNSDLTLPISLDAGDVLKVRSTARTIFGSTNSVDAHISAKET